MWGLEYQSKFNLIGPWRIKNLNARKYTKSRKNLVKKASLHFSYYQWNSYQLSIMYTILSGWRTDQCIIEINITINDFKQGKGFRRFNISLLKNTDFVINVNTIIKETDHNEYRIDESTLEIPDKLFLGVLLMRIRDMAINTNVGKINQRKERS